MESGKNAEPSAKPIKKSAQIQTQEPNTEGKWRMLLPQAIRAEGRTMHTAMHLQEGKRVGLSLAAAGDNGPKISRLYVTDRKANTRYLIDTGSDVSVFPPQKDKMFRGRRESYQLYAANGSIIPTYGTVILQPNLGLRRAFPWRFIIADVLQPIIGADFLAHYHLLPDMRRKKLIDGTTGLVVQGITMKRAVPSIKTIVEQTRYHKILTRFPEITTTQGTTPKRKQQTLHYIKTTTGQPEACRPRRLAPERYQIAKTEFGQLMKASSDRQKVRGRHLCIWYRKEQANGDRAEITAN